MNDLAMLVEKYGLVTVEHDARNAPHPFMVTLTHHYYALKPDGMMAVHAHGETIEDAIAEITWAVESGADIRPRSAFA